MMQIFIDILQTLIILWLGYKHLQVVNYIDTQVDFNMSVTNVLKAAHGEEGIVKPDAEA